MPENPLPEFNNPAANDPKPTITLSITMDRDQNIQLTGPINNIRLCYGMLEMAKDVLRQNWLSKRQPEVVPADLLDMPRM